MAMVNAQLSVYNIFINIFFIYVRDIYFWKKNNLEEQTMSLVDF